MSLLQGRAPNVVISGAGLGVVRVHIWSLNLGVLAVPFMTGLLKIPLQKNFARKIFLNLDNRDNKKHHGGVPAETLRLLPGFNLIKSFF